jgi:RHS repeat-associated protein
MKNLTARMITLVIGLTSLMSAGNSTYAQQYKEISKYQGQKETTSNGSITFLPGVTIPVGASFRAYITAGQTAVNPLIKPEMNTITTYTMRVPGIIDPADLNNGVNQVNVDVQTLDHFGRVVETQNVKASPDYKDVIQMDKYDPLGRVAKQYLPYAKGSGGANWRDKGNSGILYDYYYHPTLPRTPTMPIMLEAYSETRYQNAPDGKALEKGAPGASFRLSDGHTVRSGLLPSSYSNVAKYSAAGKNSLTGSRVLVRVNSDFYGMNTELQIDRDENVTGLNGRVYTYKNLDGQVLAKRQFNRVGSTDQVLTTHYVYDALGNLSFVLPPNTNADQSPVSQTAVDALCYQYRYDGLNRLISKKIPGKGWEYLVYNKLNQVVMTQDSMQRMKNPQQWNIVKYDAQGRNVISGVFEYGTTPGTNNRAAMQTNVDLQGKHWESRVTTGNGYTADTYPKTWTTTLSINYYDDYNFPGGNPYTYAGTDASTMTRGQLTGSKVNVLGTSNMLWSVNYYDEDGKVIRAFKQHYKGGTVVAGNYDEVSSTYDFSGAVLTSTRSHRVAGTETLKIFNEYTYDHRGRKIDSWQTMNTGTRTLLSRLEYDDLGRLYKKNQHSTSGTSFLQTTTYAYNSRGWLFNASAPLLDIKIRYESPDYGGTAQYNGNISEFYYNSPQASNKVFKYTYDNLNRLTKALHGTSGDVSLMAGGEEESLRSEENQSGPSDKGMELWSVNGTRGINYLANVDLTEEIAYDKMGNITSLKRGPSSNAATTYTYDNGGAGNRLMSTSGPVSGTFRYDGNGSATSDSRRGVKAIVYNMLNLPVAVIDTVSGAPVQLAAYTYDAGGTKLKSVQGSITREYVSGIQYTGNTLDFVSTEEGRAVRNPSTGAYTYEYNMKDNLGNVRLSFDNNAGVARVIQEDEYYAFGLNNSLYTLGTKNNYLYNGKELQSTLTDEYDYGARFYDPVIARWNVVDPLAEKGTRWSPYTYAFNNPIRYIDPDGMWPDEGDGPDDMTGVQTGMAIGGAIRDGIHGLRTLVAAAGDALGINKAAPGMKWQSVDSEGGTMGYGMAQVPSEGGLKDALGHLGDGANALAFNGSLTKGTTGTLFAKTGQEGRVASEGVQAIKEGVSLEKQALNISNNLNGGKNSVTIGTVDKQIRYDLAGRSHGGVPTPHSQVYNKNMVNGVQKNISRATKHAQPVTQQEIRSIRKFLEKQQ